MSAAEPPLEVPDFEPGDRPELFAGTSIFLSASVPEKRPYLGNERHVVEGDQPLIYAAVLALVREAFRNNINIVFGAHPSIVPMVLTVAREFPVRPGAPRVVVFQSRHFWDRFPTDTRDLANGTYGALAVTARRAVGGPREREESLTWMRTVMLRSPGLSAAVFIGGMPGVVEEAEIFHHENDELPMYALASVAGVSRDLLSGLMSGLDKDRFYGAPNAPVDPDVLLLSRVGYTRVWRSVIESLVSALKVGAVVPRR